MMFSATGDGEREAIGWAIAVRASRKRGRTEIHARKLVGGVAILLQPPPWASARLQRRPAPSSS